MLYIYNTIFGHFVVNVNFLFSDISESKFFHQTTRKFKNVQFMKLESMA